MYFCTLDKNDIVTNVIIVNSINDCPKGYIECDEWIGIGMNINTPKPTLDPTANENKSIATSLLQQTDWTSVADIGDSQLSNPYLANQAEFIAWRSQLRAIAVNPVAGYPVIFGEKPQEVWQSSGIPTTVSMRQARLALFQDGLLNQVQTAIDAMTEPTKTTTQISWDYATVVNRDDDLVIQLSAQLGLSDADLDALFTLAASL